MLTEGFGSADGFVEDTFGGVGGELEIFGGTSDDLFAAIVSVSFVGFVAVESVGSWLIVSLVAVEFVDGWAVVVVVDELASTTFGNLSRSS